MRRTFFVFTVVGLAALIASAVSMAPDIRRYLRMRAM